MLCRFECGTRTINDTITVIATIHNPQATTSKQSLAVLQKITINLTVESYKKKRFQMFIQPNVYKRVRLIPKTKVDNLR